jgi:hypothetical protein
VEVPEPSRLHHLASLARSGSGTGGRLPGRGRRPPRIDKREQGSRLRSSRPPPGREGDAGCASSASTSRRRDVSSVSWTRRPACS